MQPQAQHSALTLVRDAIRRGIDIQILFYSDEYLCSTNRVLAIFGSSRRYIARNLSISTLLAADQQHLIKVHPITPGSSLGDQMDQLARPIDEFFWLLAYRMAADGRLLPGCQAHDLVYLQRWPNFTRLPHTPAMMRLAALLAARPTPVDVAARTLDIPITEAFRFYSAARYAGYTDTLDHTPKPLLASQPSAGDASERLGVIRSLWRRLIRAD